MSFQWLMAFMNGKTNIRDDDALKLAEFLDVDVNSIMQLKRKTADDAIHEASKMMRERMEQDEAEPEYDEHAWLSLPRAHAFCLAAASQLGAIDPDHAVDYLANAEAYNQKLDELDNAFAGLADSAKQIHQPVLYMTG